MDRVHLVLVAGFSGFDALGQLQYYAGVTAVFQRWREPVGSGRLPVLHYFDNFPTAGVSTRAARLRQYLAKRIARGEFAPHDEVVLVGHSTRGLDIRRLVWDLATDAAARKPVDGGRVSGTKGADRDILNLCRTPRSVAVAARNTIRTCSYATLARRPQQFGDALVEPWDFIQPRTYPDLAPNATNQGTGVFFRICYRACAGGPFKPPESVHPNVSYLDPAHEALIRKWAGGRVMPWDNDGIVNTASMTWRDSEDVVLVPGDHMDIVGRHSPERADGSDGRQFQAYDLLGSASQFTVKTSSQVWDDVFARAVERNSSTIRADVGSHIETEGGVPPAQVVTTSSM